MKLVYELYYLSNKISCEGVNSVNNVQFDKKFFEGIKKFLSIMKLELDKLISNSDEVDCDEVDCNERGWIKNPDNPYDPDEIEVNEIIQAKKAFRDIKKFNKMSSGPEKDSAFVEYLGKYEDVARYFMQMNTDTNPIAIEKSLREYLRMIDRSSQRNKEIYKK